MKLLLASMLLLSGCSPAEIKISEEVIEGEVRIAEEVIEDEFEVKPVAPAK
jgi:hypothetical protein